MIVEDKCDEYTRIFMTKKEFEKNILVYQKELVN